MINGFGNSPCVLGSCAIGKALDGMCVSLVITNAAGKVEWMNRSARQTLGIDESEALDRPFGQLLRDPNMAEFWHRAQSGCGIVMGDVSLHWPAVCQLKVNASCSTDADGVRIGHVLLFCDVSAERSVQLQLSQEATERLLRLAEQSEAREPSRPHAGLTAHELRVLRMVGAGLSNEAIAKAMHVAPSTTRTHLKHVYAKLGLSTRAEAVRYALTNGLV